MHLSSVVCLLLALFALSQADNEKCSSEGQEFSTNNVYYKCTNGSLIPFACASESGKKVLIGDTFETVGYEMRCTQLLSNWIQPVPVACMQNGKRLAPGETFVDQSFWYTCVQKNQTVAIELSGCVSDSGDKVGSGQKFRSGDFMFTCVRHDTGGVTVQPSACIVNGKEVPVGDQVQEENFYYTCNLQGDTGIGRSLSGCVNDGKKLGDGGKYVKDGFIYKCESQNGAVSHTVVGCIGESNKEYYMNGRWTEGTAPFRFIVECSRGAEHKIQKKIVQCSYESSEGQAQIDPGCTKKVGSTFVQCIQNGDNGLNFRTVTSSAAAGLKMC